MDGRHRPDASAGAVVLVVADDLTGANATAARFARRGLRTVTVSDPARLGGFRDDYDVLVCDTASRHRAPAEAARLVEEALAAAEAGDLAPFHRLVEVLARPFDERPGLESFAAPAATDFDASYRTFCGT